MVNIDTHTIFNDFYKCLFTSPGAEVLPPLQFSPLHTRTPPTNNSSFTTTSKSWANQSAPIKLETHYSDFGSAPKKS